MPHLRSVDKGTFLRLREDVTSPMKANFIPKMTKINELPRLLPLGPPPGRCSAPTGGIIAAPKPHALNCKKKSTIPPTPTRIHGFVPVFH